MNELKKYREVLESIKTKNDKELCKQIDPSNEELTSYICNIIEERLFERLMGINDYNSTKKFLEYIEELQAEVAKAGYRVSVFTKAIQATKQIMKKLFEDEFVKMDFFEMERAINEESELVVAIEDYATHLGVAYIKALPKASLRELAELKVLAPSGIDVKYVYRFIKERSVELINTAKTSWKIEDNFNFISASEKIEAMKRLLELRNSELKGMVTRESLVTSLSKGKVTIDGIEKYDVHEICYKIRNNEDLKKTYACCLKEPKININKFLKRVTGCIFSEEEAKKIYNDRRQVAEQMQAIGKEYASPL